MDHTAHMSHAPKPATSETMYTCPMDPDVILNHPGNCPKCGMKLMPVASEHEDHMEASMEKDFQRRFFITLPFVLFSMLLSSNIQKWLGISYQFYGQNMLLFGMGTFLFLFGGLPFFQGAAGEWKAKNAGMMTLVSLAITAGYFFSVAATFLFAGESLYWEIATLISVFLLGHWLEMRSVRGTTGALAELAKLIPPMAHLVKGAHISDVQTRDVQVGDTLLVKPGEKVPIDGVVVNGESSVNESMVTGESRPVVKTKRSVVIGGTLNQDGSLTIKVTKTGADTAIAQIMELIAMAQSSKPNVQLLADRAASWLTFAAIFAGVSAFIFWIFFIPQGVVFAATLAVAAIVVACPHALGLAIPTVTTITSTLGAKNGILIKDMKALELARKIDYVVFDKTGTLTKGEFGVASVQTRSTLSADEVLRLASAVEAHSQHSIAKGIIAAAQQKKIDTPRITGFKSFPGKGAQATVERKTVVVGNAALLNELKFSVPLSTEAAVGTSVYVVVHKTVVGIISLVDIVRDESEETVKRLHTMGIKVAMLTGDTKDVAEAVGKDLGVDTVFSGVFPHQKVDKVKELQHQGHIVAMVGDGVNDAPSLAQSHVGIAIGAGTDVAIESAGIVLMRSDPLDVVKAISLSRKTHIKMIQNLVWATGYNVFAIPIAAGALYPSLGILLRPEWAALLMSASSIIVVANALLLRRTKL